MVKKQRGVASVKIKSSDGLEKALVENSIALQRVLVNLSVKFDNLSENIAKLLNLFELSAKSFMEKGGEIDKGNLSQKIDSLLEQNKILAKGIAMVYEKPFATTFPSPSQPPQPQSQETNLEGYQHSLQMGESANVSSPNSRFKSLQKRENA